MNESRTNEPITPRVKCLVVDDLQENLLAFSALLRGGDVEILTARSGREALELLLVHEVALAILDVQMPEMDGFELAEIMRGSERTQSVPLIFVTAGVRDQQRLFKGYDSGAVDFLYKPIESHILKSKAEIFFQLQRQKQQLAQELNERTETLRLNEMFTAVLGHDLRTPLNAIAMSALLLQRHADTTVRDTATRMLSSSKRMGRMIEDILDLARARLADGIPLNRSKVDLLALVQRVAQENQIAFAERQIEVLPDGDLNGEWDAERLAQVAANLIGNAIQHGATSESIKVQLDGTQRDTVVLSVINAGSISPEVLPHIFKPFRAGERDTGRNEGLGLGLYIVKEIVRAHKGSIEVQSPQGKHTVFRIQVPRSITGL